MAMISDQLFSIAVLAALGCGLMAGLFFTFSNFVMRAFRRTSPGCAITVMQAINETIVNPLFLLLFLGTSVACALLIVHAVTHLQNDGSLLRLVGSATYLIGCILVTFVCNIPRNNALAEVDATTPAAITLWDGYMIGWTRWNHVRTVSAVIATLLLMLALR